MLIGLGEKRLASRKPVYVLDATPIIHFAKITKLDHVLGICDAYITREVYREAVDRGQGKPDAMLIRDAVERGEITVYDVRDRRLVDALLRHPEIHAGEAETLAAAKELNAFAIVDEAEARAVGKTYAIQTRTGTLFLLFKLLAAKQVEPEECLRILDELVESGLYIDSLTLTRARRKIEQKASGRWLGLCFYDGMDAGGTATTECPPKRRGSEWKHESPDLSRGENQLREAFAISYLCRLMCLYKGESIWLPRNRSNAMSIRFSSTKTSLKPSTR
jgi:predicted nucleic acid-binding protein